MTYEQLIRAIATKTSGSPRAVDKTLDALRDVIHGLEVGGSVTLPKLGTFNAKMRSPRKVTTLKGTVVDVPARRAITFRQAKSKPETA